MKDVIPSFCALILVLAIAGAAHAHDGAVGIAQAKVTEGEALVLLKFRTSALLEKLYDDEAKDGSVLASEDGRNKVLDLLVETHSVSTKQALCERDKIERFELTPSGKWFDIIIRYRCPRPHRTVRLKIATLLDGTNHRIMGSFESKGVVTKTILTRRRPTYTFKLSVAPPKKNPPAAQPQVEQEVDDEIIEDVAAHFDLLLLGFFFLSVAAAIRIRLAAGAVLLTLIVSIWSLGVAFGQPFVLLASFAGQIGLAALFFNHHIKGLKLVWGDLVLVGAVGLCVGVSISSTCELTGVPVLGLLSHGAAVAVGVVLGAVLNRWEGERFRRVTGWVGLVGAVVILVGLVSNV